MIIENLKADLQERVAEWRAQGLRVGFVPTMGALHEGHLALVRLALQRADRVAVSIFVNPSQFAPHEDFAAYPRQEAEDLEKLQKAGAHLVYLPPESEIYPDGRESPVSPGLAARGLESDFRPHFFGGVVNVVARLFDHVRPDIAVFGEKDYQQLCVIREMVAALGLPIEIIGAPVVRDGHGLALSSRNAYLSAEGIVQARGLNKVLRETAARLRSESNNVEDILAQGREEILRHGFKSVDYLALANSDTLQIVSNFKMPARLLVAAHLGPVRLIDNIAV